MRATDVVSDASVAVKWFHSTDEEEVEEAHELVAAHKRRAIRLATLDLTAYEIGNALLRGRARADAARVTVVLEALAEICPAVQPDASELSTAAELAQRHGLTFYDGAYAAVAQRRGAVLVTLDRALLAADLGVRPSELVPRLRR